MQVETVPISFHWPLGVWHGKQVFVISEAVDQFLKIEKDINDVLIRLGMRKLHLKTEILGDRNNHSEWTSNKHTYMYFEKNDKIYIYIAVTPCMLHFELLFCSRPRALAARVYYVKLLPTWNKDYLSTSIYIYTRMKTVAKPHTRLHTSITPTKFNHCPRHFSEIAHQLF